MRVAAKPDPRFRTPPVGSIDLDRTALRKRLEGDLEGEVRFRAGDRALYATGGSNYRMIPIGVVIPKSVDDVARDDRRLPRARRADPLARRRHEPRRPDRQRRRRHRLLEVPEPHRSRSTRSASSRGCSPGSSSTTCGTRPRRATGSPTGPDPSTHDHCTLGGMIGNNSCGVHSVMSQFYGPGPLHGRPSRRARRASRTEATASGAGDARARAGPHDLGRRPPGRDLRKLRDLRDRVGDLVRERYPQLPRRVSGYNLDRLLPEHGFDVAAALTGTEGTCVTDPRGDRPPDRQPARAQPARPRLRRRRPRRRPRPDGARAHEPLGLEGVDDVLIEDMTPRAPARRGHRRCCPSGTASCSSSSAARRKRRPTRRRTRSSTEVRAGGQALPRLDALRRQGGRGHVWAVREAGLGATAFIPGKADTYEGWEDSAVPPERVGEYIRELRKLAGELRLRERPLRPLRPGLHPRALELRPEDEAGHREVPALPRRRVRPRPLDGRLAVRRARRRPVARGAAPEDVRRRARRGVPRVQVDLGPRLEDEPRQGRRPLPDHRQPATGHRLRADRGRPALRLSGRQRLLRARHGPLRRDRQVPPHRGRGHVPELHGHARGEAHDARSCPPPVRDARGSAGRRHVAGRRGLRGARPLPVVQGLHERLPGARRHADAEVRVPRSPLREAPAPAPRLCVRADRPGGPCRLARARRS